MRLLNSQAVPRGTASVAGWLIAIAGVVPAIIMALFMTGPDAREDPKGFADAATGAAGIVEGYLYILALIGLLFGLFALCSALGAWSGDRLAIGGLLFSGIGVGLLLASFGAMILGAAVAGDVYLGGDANAAAVMQKFNGGSLGGALFSTMVVALVLSLIGAVLFGITIWRSGVLPKWAAVPFVLGLVLVVATVPVGTQIGGILLLVAGVGIARSDTLEVRTAQAGEPQPA